MDAFWKNVEINKEDECWPWMRGKTPKGYGSAWINGKFVRANRYALEDSKGPPPSEDMYALHSCDNTSCCNPAHLRWGTQKENMQDAVLRKRNAFGGKSSSSLINEETASLIMRMRMEGFRSPDIAKKLSLGEGLVMAVYTGRSWAHLHGVNGNPTKQDLNNAKCKRGPSANRVLTDGMIDRILQGRMEGLTCKDLANELGIKEGTASPVFCGKMFSERHGLYGNPTTEDLVSFKVSRKALTFDETTDVIRLLEAGYTGDSIAKKYGVGKATISRIRSSIKR